MRAVEFDSNQQLDEIAVLQSIKGWFAPKYKAFMDKNEAARQAGEAQIRKFTNDHMNTFGTHMGRYRQDWPNVTLYVVYQYLRRTMGLDDNEISQIINDVMQESGQKPVNLQAIKNPKSNIKVGLNAQRAQITAEKIIAAASLVQLEKHWDNAAGVASNATEEPQDKSEKVVDVNPILTDNEPIKIGDEIIKPTDPRYAKFAAAIKATGKPYVKEYNDFNGNLYDLIETATGGATASGSIASVASPMGNTISRTPNLFGYIPAQSHKKTKKRRNRRKSAP